MIVILNNHQNKNKKTEKVRDDEIHCSLNERSEEEREIHQQISGKEMPDSKPEELLRERERERERF
jgi:hypothetical protein